VLSSRPADIGAEYCNRWWEHAVLGLLLGLAVFGAGGAITSTYDTVSNWGRTTPTVSQQNAAVSLAKIPGVELTIGADGHVISADFGRRPLAQPHLALLRQLDHLEHLDLRGADISDGDLRYLHGLRRLRSLVLPGNLSKAATDRIHTHLPDCMVSSDRSPPVDKETPQP